MYTRCDSKIGFLRLFRLGCMKKTYSYFLLSLFPLSFLAGENNLEEQISSLEEKFNSITDCTVFGSLGPEFVSTKQALDGVGLYFTLDALYWKMFEGGTEFVYTDKNNIIDQVANLTTIEGKSKKVDFNWNWGYRIGAAYTFPCSSWGLYLNYTDLDNKGEKSAQETPGGVLVPLYLTYTPAHSFSAASRWKVDFSTLDLEFGRDFFVSCYLNLRPYVGIRGARINQHVRAHYVDFVDSIDTHVTLKNNFSGIGLRGGLGSQWFFFQRFSFCIDASASLLRGRFHVNFNEFSTLPFFPTTGILNDRLRVIVPNVQFYLGLGWESAACASWSYAFKIGYESQFWWNQNQAPHGELSIVFPYGKRVEEDLSMHGLTIKAEIDF